MPGPVSPAPLQIVKCPLLYDVVFFLCFFKNTIMMIRYGHLHFPLCVCLCVSVAFAGGDGGGERAATLAGWVHISQPGVPSYVRHLSTSRPAGCVQHQVFKCVV